MTLRRSWREFIHDWARYLAVLLLIALAVGVVVSLCTASLASLDAMQRGRVAGRLADGEFTTIAPLSTRQQADLRELGLTLEAAPSLDLTRGTKTAKTTVRLLGVPTTMNRPSLEAGRLPTAPDEVMVEQLHAAAVGLKIGDRIVVDGRPLRVVGLGSLPHYAYPLAERDDVATDNRAFGVLLLSRPGFEAFADRHPSRVVATYAYLLDSATEDSLRSHLLDLPVDPFSVHNRLLADALHRAEQAGLDLDYPALEDFLPAEDNLRITSGWEDAELNLTTTLIAGVLLMLLVGYVLAAFTRDRLVRDATTIGALSALGFTRTELVLSYLALPALVAFAASALGTALGPVAAPSFTFAAGYYSIPALDMVPPWPMVAAAVLFPAVLVSTVNLVVLARQLSVTPVALLRPMPEGGNGPQLKLRRLSFSAAFRIRQALRSLGSYALIACGVGLAILLLVFGLGMDATIRQYVVAVETDLAHEHLYTLRFPDLDRVPAGAQAATTVPMRVIEHGADRGEVTVLGITDANPYFAANVDDLAVHDLVISDAVAFRYGVGPGDRLVLREAEGDLNWSFTVARVVRYSSGLFVFTTRAHAQELVDPAIVTLSALMSSDGALVTGEDLRIDEVAAGRFYNTLLSDDPLSLDPDRTAGHTTRADVLSAVSTFNELMGGLVLTIAAVAIALFVVVLSVLVRMIVRAQRYRISLMKALGYSDREVARLFLANYFWVVVAVLATAIPLSTVVVGPIWRAMIAHVPMGIAFQLPPPTAALIVALALASYGAVRVASGQETRRVPVVEILKYRE